MRLTVIFTFVLVLTYYVIHEMQSRVLHSSTEPQRTMHSSSSYLPMFDHTQCVVR